MPRPPKLQPKSNRIVLIPKPDQEEMLRGFREIHARNGLSMSDTLFACVEAFLKKHNWPPGQSQTQLVDAFGEELYDKPQMLPRWKTCHYSQKTLQKQLFYCFCNLPRFGHSPGLYPPSRCGRCDYYRPD